MNIGYVRVSTREQNTARQIEALNKLDMDRIYEEKISGKDTNRQQLKEMLNFAREGDVIYIESLSRLGRSLKDLLNIVDTLNNKGVGLVSLKESHINTTTPQGKLIFNIFASLSEFERETIRERQKEGIEIAKKQGKFKGRQKQEIDKEKFKEIYDRWKAGEITAVKAMQVLGLKKNTFYRRVTEYEETAKESRT